LPDALLFVNVQLWMLIEVPLSPPMAAPLPPFVVLLLLKVDPVIVIEPKP